jgi:hypothetical protein
MMLPWLAVIMTAGACDPGRTPSTNMFFAKNPDAEQGQPRAHIGKQGIRRAVAKP